jgi:hypothetical protein
MLITRHNDLEGECHLKLHEVVCIGDQWKEGVAFMELTTPHLMFNLVLAMQSALPVHVQADGSFDYCASKLCILVF